MSDAVGLSGRERERGSNCLAQLRQGGRSLHALDARRLQASRHPTCGARACSCECVGVAGERRAGGARSWRRRGLAWTAPSAVRPHRCVWRMDVQDDIAEAEKGNFEAKLRSMNVIINFAPGFLQIFQKLQSTYYVSRDAELFKSQVRTSPCQHDVACSVVSPGIEAPGVHLLAGTRRPARGLRPRRRYRCRARQQQR